MSLTLWILGAYLLLCLVLAIYGWSKSKGGMEDFFLCSRQVGGFIAFMTFSATLFSSFMLVGMPGFFYTHGIGAWAFVIFADVLMAILVYFVGTKLWEIAKKKKIVTPTEFIKKTYKSSAAMVIALVISFVFLLPYISTQIIGLGIILGGVVNIPPFYLSLIIVGIIFLYSELGGMRSVSWTDALQGTILVVISLILMFGIISHFGGINSFFSQVAQVDSQLLDVPGPKGLFTYPMLFSFFLMIVLMPVTQPQLTMIFLIPKSKKVLRTMMIALPIFALLAIIPTLFVGFGAKLLDANLASGDLALNTVLGIFPEIIVALAIVGVIAASMSTADSQVLALSSLVAQDLFPKKSRMMIARVAIFVIIMLALALSVNPPQLIVTLSVLSFAGTLQLAPTMLGALFWKKGTADGAIASMLLGTLTLVLYQWFADPLWGFHAGFWGLVVATVVYVVVSKVTYKKK